MRRTLNLVRYSSGVQKHALDPRDTFVRRHIGSDEVATKEMLRTVGVSSLGELVGQTVPQDIRRGEMRFGDELRASGPSGGERERGEMEALAEFREMMSANKVVRSYLGQGYYDTHTPNVILRNVLENPGFYTPYTPYQAEIAQGRLELLFCYQTMVAELTGMAVSNASLLDEATAAAEAMNIAFAQGKRRAKVFYVSPQVHPQTIAVVQTRALALDAGLKVIVAEPSQWDLAHPDGVCGALLQYPHTDGVVVDHSAVTEKLRSIGALSVAACDPLSLMVLKEPGAVGFDVAVGTTQRFGVPMGYGGPHAGFLATTDRLKRSLPGRLIGLSKDAGGRPAYRMSLQTREQHIRREKATSNICTAQALLANISVLYAMYHGPHGLRDIALSVHGKACILADAVAKQRVSGLQVIEGSSFFDTVRFQTPSARHAEELKQRVLEQANANVRTTEDGGVIISMDETVTANELRQLALALGVSEAQFEKSVQSHPGLESYRIPKNLQRTSNVLKSAQFHSFHTEHEMLRYLNRIQSRDIGLHTSMISLGSCTMKLNATSEMIPVTWPEVGKLHPFAPVSQAKGYTRMFDELKKMLCELTGFAAVSLQPNSGAQGEFAGLLAIKSYHEERGDKSRNVCLIPTSAHGTNPASAVMAGMRVVIVECDRHGNIDVDDLRRQIEAHRKDLSCLMITYPSTHGVFEESVRQMCELVHSAGGLVYMDGANMNAQVGLSSPGFIGADVCHLNLHKTLCIPHGGGGPGVGAIGVNQRLLPYLPGHPVVSPQPSRVGPVAAAPWGSASILPITYMYAKMMGARGLKTATEMAILNANYMATRLGNDYKILYKGKGGRNAHEFIVDLRSFKDIGIEAEDVAKRLMDYGFHAPTLAFPIPGTLMVEPTESESKAEMDRFIDALLRIRAEIADVEAGKLPADNNPLVRAPHPLADLLTDVWDRPYSRESAAYPAPWLRDFKHWPNVSRIDGVFGDKNLICSCPPLSEYQ